MSEDIPLVVTIDCETGEETSRPMTAEELEAREIARLAWVAEQEAQAAAAAEYAALKASAKAKLVAGQPLTEEEAATIVL